MGSVKVLEERSEIYIAKSKFNVDSDVSKRTYNNIVYDSILEMRFYKEWLIPKIESGEIIDCQKQVKYELQPKFEYQNKTIQPIFYVADFVCKYIDGSICVIDTKGYADAVAILKKKMFKYKYPNLNYIWMSYSVKDGGWVLYDDLKKARSQRKKEKNNK